MDAFVRACADLRARRPGDTARACRAQPRRANTILGFVSTVAFLGPAGTFTDAALQQLAARGRIPGAEPATLDTLACDTPAEALAAVRDGRAEFACVPFENSVDGTVSPTADSLASGTRLQILAETELDIAFAILVRPGTAASDVRTLSTHPIAAAQVRSWVRENLPDAQIHTTSSTAAGAEEVASGEADAAAAPARAGEILGLEALAEGIADVSGARTRFVLVGAPTTPPEPTGNDRTSVVFGLRHEPNALVQALTELSIRGINLSRIESRPTRVDRFTYFFHVDLVGHIADPMVAEALAALHHRTSRLRFLGSWPVDTAGDEGTPADRAGAISPPDRTEGYAWTRAMSTGRG